MIKWVRLSSWIFVGSCALIISYYVLFPHVWHCQWIDFSDFKKINPRLYISTKIPQKYVHQADILVKEARHSIEQLWGESQGRGTVIICSTSEEYERYCHSSEGAGCSIGTPWGESFIILNLDGLNVDVIAHEMCHDELFCRLGWWTTTRQIPQWFNEGLALMVDHRFVSSTDSIQRYIDYQEACLSASKGGQTVLELKEISTMKGFFGGDESRVFLAYMTAATEVSRWLMKEGTNQIPYFIYRIKAGESFDDIYPFVPPKGMNKRHQ
ncbi:MAG: hypothetical protein R2822_29320 [Spirosomataceae bacterium]